MIFVCSHLNLGCYVGLELDRRKTTIKGSSAITQGDTIMGKWDIKISRIRE